MESILAAHQGHPTKSDPLAYAGIRKTGQIPIFYPQLNDFG